MRVLVINLDRRKDRWDAFPTRHHFPHAWSVERFRAIDGNRVPPPDWWTAGSGAWGCYRSHLSIIERGLNEDWPATLILEDDAVFADDSADKLLAAAQALPDDWGMAYFGGQHRFAKQQPPRRVNDWWDQPYDVNRTHAYAVRGDMWEALYLHLQRRDWQNGHHIDHHYGRLHQQGGYAVYSVRPWLVGQGAGRSNISGHEAPERFWANSGIVAPVISPSQPDKPMVAVVGVFRGGTSCVAGILHHLGVHMGNRFKPAGPANPQGFWEAQQLAQICRQSYQEPGMAEKNDYATRVRRLYRWGAERQAEAERTGTIAGGKHPTLSLMIPELLEAWGNVRFVRVTRPLQDTMNSLRRRKWGFRQPTIQNMLAKRDRDLEGQDVFDIDYTALYDRRQEIIADLATFLNIEPTADQIRAATQSVHASNAAPPARAASRACC